MDTFTEVKTNCFKLGEMISRSFSEFNAQFNLDKLKLYIAELHKKGYDVMLETNVNGENNYSFKTAVINLENYLGYTKEKIDYNFILSFLEDEKERAIKNGESDSAAVISHVKNRIFDIEGNGTGNEEIVQLFQLLPPYKLMKYDIKCKKDKIIVTAITPFDAFLKQLKYIFFNL